MIEKYQISNIKYQNKRHAHVFGNILGVVCVVVLGVISLSIGAQVWATTNISSVTTDHFAWNDLMGWVDFYSTNTVTVTSQGLAGYASSTAGDVSVDCSTTRAGDICATSSYHVTNDGLGNLSGYAWNDTYGWLSFDCNNHGGCATSSYRVFIDPDSGIFQNYAWNDVAGWVSFNCQDPGLCGAHQYKVDSAWVATSTTGILDSATFDTGTVLGAQLNSFLWRGTTPAGTEVHFQFATSVSSDGPWSFIGPDGTSDSYYTVIADTSKSLDFTLHNNQRYFRYRVILVSNQAQTQTPEVQDVVVNWSP